MMLARSATTFLLLFAVAAQAAPPIPKNLRELSLAYQESGETPDRAALTGAVASMPPSERAFGALALGYAQVEREDWEAAVRTLSDAAAADLLADYTVYLRGRAFAKAEKFAEAAWVLKGFAQKYPASRLKPAAARIRAESLLREQRFAEVREAVADGTGIAGADKHYLLGRVLELEGKLTDAVASYRRVYYFHPRTEQADAAEDRLNALNRSMGSNYPDAPADWRLKRADILFDRAYVSDAAEEYERAIPGLSGKDRERARLRQAVANYRRLHTTTAQTILQNLELSDPELAAERLYYLGECARRKDQISVFRGMAERLGREHPKSPWYEEALFSLGNFYLLDNDGAQYRDYYHRAARAFPKGKYAEKAHWKVCWRAYIDRDKASRHLFEEHVRLYPGSAQASAALYWLARFAEKDGAPATARAIYQKIDERFPNYYYAYLARERMPHVAGATGANKYAELLDALPTPRRIDQQARPENQRILDRGRTLFALGMDQFAEQELLTADYRQSDAPLVGLELARQSAERDDHFRAMRHMKRYGFGYLRLPIESMPREFWERLYPLPYEDELRGRARPHELDPFLVAGLIRQESEFNPRAVSRAGAMGLMQLMPSTGSGLARRLGVAGFSKRRLHDPDTSLRLGTFHLKEVVERYQGDLELTLAAYNAGESRANRWVQWADFEEPGEFVETIPFTETRGYVQSVLRNRDMYRRLYGSPQLADSTPSRDRLADAQ